jgi:hypothetical protein
MDSHLHTTELANPDNERSLNAKVIAATEKI